MTPRNAGIMRAGLALILALLYDILFYKKGLGINFPSFVILALIGFAALTLAANLFRNRWAIVLAIPTLGLALSPALFSNEFSVYAAPVLALLGLVVICLVLTVQTNGLPLYLSQLALPRHFDGLVSNWKNIYQDLFSWREGQAKRVVWGIVISFPLLIIFASLLADADPIFAEWLKDLNIWEGIWRVFRTVVVTLIIAAFFYLLASEKNTLSAKNTKIFKMDTVTVGVVLALLNALFILFVYIQIKYLFGGATYVLANDITLAEYARNGFFELVRVVGIAAVLVILVQRSFSHHGSHWSVNALQALFIGQVGIVAASALRRMALYQDNYGFTTLRLYVEWFIYALIGALIFSGLALLFKMSFRRFFQSLLAAAFVVAAFVSLVNVDFLIAQENIGRWRNEKKSLDMNYISSLSRDVAPAFTDLTPPEHFEKLNISQKLAFDDLITSFTHINASSTKLAYTWSQQKSEQFIASLPANVKTSIQLAKVKDKKYEGQSQEINNAVVYNQNPCITNFLNVSLDNAPETRPDFYGSPYKNTMCVDLLPNNETQIQAQLISINSETKGEAVSRPTKISQDYIYAIISYDQIKKQAFILYKMDLPGLNQEGEEFSQPGQYILQKNGNLVESDYANRDFYVYSLINDNGYRLTDKKLY